MLRLGKKDPYQILSLKGRNDLHLARKLWHCLGLLVIIGLYLETPTETFLYWFFLSSAVAIALDFLRLYIPLLNNLALLVFGTLMRQNEAKQLSGLSYLLIACIILFLLGQRDIILLTLLFLAFADPLASYVGIRMRGEPLVGNKTLEGSLTSGVVCTITFTLYCFTHNILVDRLLILAPLVGLIGALAELTPIGRLDDNLTFPLLTGFGLTLIFIVYGYL